MLKEYRHALLLLVSFLTSHSIHRKWGCKEEEKVAVLLPVVLGFLYLDSSCSAV